MPSLPRVIGYERLRDFQHKSERMRGLLRVAERVAPTDCSLLILGETGVGKEWLARAIHREGPRASGPFVAVNTAALPEALLESELFGHEKGSFTGAHRLQRGQFELAEGGTLFLDEIGDMPVALQVKLLRVLEERSIRRVGGETPIEVDTRIVAATSRDLESAIEARQFRSDLYFRLGVIVLTVPPLRERREDLPDIVAIALERFARHYSRPVRSISDRAMAELGAYSWPGNVRQLLNVVERAVLLADGEELTPKDFTVLGGGEGAGAQAPSPVAASKETLSGDEVLVLPESWWQRPWQQVRREILMDVEKRYLEAILEKASGRINRAAAMAGYDPRFLYERMRAHGLRKEPFRARTGD